MKLIAHDVWSLNPEQLEMGLLYLIGQHLAGEIDQEKFMAVYQPLLNRMDQEGVRMIQWEL